MIVGKKKKKNVLMTSNANDSLIHFDDQSVCLKILKLYTCYRSKTKYKIKALK